MCRRAAGESLGSARSLGALQCCARPDSGHVRATRARPAHFRARRNLSRRVLRHLVHDSVFDVPALRNKPERMQKRSAKTKRHTIFRVPFVLPACFQAFSIEIPAARFPAAARAAAYAALADQSPNSFWRSSRRSCASSESVAVGRAIRRGMPIGSPVSSHQP